MIEYDKESAGLYIHIPFCLSKCGYCSFYSVPSPHLIPDFVKAVTDEMGFYSDTFHIFDTLYLGGGTPSLLTVGQIRTIVHSAYKSFTLDRLAEITIEVNPGDISLDYLETLRSIGINRLNIGVQSFDDDILRFLGRRHTAKEALSSLEAAHKAGFENIGIDLIYGVYGQDINTWQQTLKDALSLSPEHISCYQLSLDIQTPLHKHYGQHRISLPSEQEALNFFLTTSHFLEEAGYIHYEVSNFARSNALKSRHNTKYWRHTPYLGLGPAAHSFYDSKRWWNKTDVIIYAGDIFEHHKPLEETETLSLEQLALETLFLGLRTKDGINLEQYMTRFGIDLLSDKKKTIDELIRNKLVEIKNGFLCPTLAGMAVADSLALI